MKTYRSREKSFLRILMIAGILLVLLFGFKTVKSVIRVARSGLTPGTTQVELVRGWMTIPYIARAYNVPEAFIFEKLDLPAKDYRKKSLLSISRERFPDKKGVLIEEIKAVLLEYQKSKPGIDLP